MMPLPQAVSPKDVQYHPCLRILKELFPDKYERARSECWTICLPDPGSIKDDLDLDADFFDLHLIKEQEGEGWFKGTNPVLPLIVEATASIAASGKAAHGHPGQVVGRPEGEPRLKVLSAPGYAPSFSKGLYFTKIIEVVYDVNQRFSQYKMFLLDRPLVPKYSKSGLGDSLLSSSSIASSSGASTKDSYVQFSSVGTESSHLFFSGKTQSRQSSASSTGSRSCSNTNEGVASRQASSIRDDQRPSRRTRGHPAGDGTVCCSHLAKSKSEQNLDIPIIKGKPRDRGVDAQIHQQQQQQGPEDGPEARRLSKKRSPRQWSADSGVGPESTSPREDCGGDRQSLKPAGIRCLAETRQHLGVDQPYKLPARITAYAESEGYLLNLPRCDQFTSHLARSLKPLMEGLDFAGPSTIRQQLKDFSVKLHRLAQESVISFPRSASTVNNSPRFSEFLRIAVENVVLGAVHDRIFPVICKLSRSEDRDLLVTANYLHSQRIFSADRLGLPEDFCVPLSAAVVELAALDMRTTPLDRMTCVYDTVEQVKAHIKEAILELRGEDLAGNEELIPLMFPDDDEMVLLLASVVVQARPSHLLSSLNYADDFAWTVPSDMIDCVTLFSSAVDFVRNFQPTKHLQPSSGKLKGEVSMEEMFKLTDELQRSYDKQGNRLEPFKSALEIHKEKFAQRLEKSTADRTKRQEEAWARLDQCPTPTPSIQFRPKRGLLATIHTKLICSSESSNQK